MLARAGAVLGAGAVGVAAGSWITFRFVVDAVAAYPHRDGASQEIWLMPALPASPNTPPVRMTWNMTLMTSSGMVFSDVFTAAEMNRPSVIDAMASRPIPSSSSTSGRLVRNDPVAGSSRPARPISTSAIAWIALITPRMISLENRYTPADRPAARSLL